MAGSAEGINRYYDEERLGVMVSKGLHRNAIGGLWDEVGPMQLDYLRRNGLSSDMRLVDIGCGCLRGGVHFVAYLEPGNYYGIDISQHLLDAGYDIELAALDLTDRQPRENLRQTPDFDLSPFGVTFDMAVAQSVFTHLTQNHVRLCLDRLADAMAPGSRFYATVFHCPDDQRWRDALHHEPGGIVTHPDRDPFHYRREHLEQACSDLPWQLEAIEDWAHPRNQKMAIFRRH